jgi:hypothetical protein
MIRWRDAEQPVKRPIPLGNAAQTLMRECALGEFSKRLGMSYVR